MSQNFGSPLCHTMSQFVARSAPLTCDVIYGGPQKPQCYSYIVFPTIEKYCLDIALGMDSAMVSSRASKTRELFPHSDVHSFNLVYKDTIIVPVNYSFVIL